MARRTTDSKDRLSQALAYFSIGLGAAQAQSPAHMCRTVGIRPTPGSRTLMRAVGLQELAVGTGILALPRRAGLLWTRVAGDVAHLALLGVALQSKDSDRRRIARIIPVGRSDGNDRRRVVTTIAAVAGVTVLDVIAGVRRGREEANTGALRAQTSLTINRPAEEVYRQWRDLERLPAFMAHLESVRMTGNGRSHWVARAPAGRTVEWDAEIVDDRPNEVIAWRSVDRAAVPNAGRVLLAPTREGRATEMTVELEYHPPGGKVGKAVATLLGEEPRQQLRDDLRRFKQVVETGEVVRSDGSPDGTITQRLLRQRPARPPD
jgi:uncharacterized membrane protein